MISIVLCLFQINMSYPDPIYTDITMFCNQFCHWGCKVQYTWDTYTSNTKSRTCTFVPKKTKNKKHEYIKYYEETPVEKVFLN